MHWQVFVAAVSPARNPASGYQVGTLENHAPLMPCVFRQTDFLCCWQAWGHSTIVNPWGEVVATTEHDAAMVTAELDLTGVEEVRRNIPVSMQKRDDLYDLVDKKA